jgi:hypothetical protein
MATLNGSMSTEGETLQVSLLPYRCSICPTLVTYQAPDVSCMRSTVSADCPRWPVRSAATLLEFHVPLMNCFVCRWFCMVHGLKPLLHHHNWLSFGKFQDTECFLIPCPHHVLSRQPPSGQIHRYVMAPNAQKKTWRDSLPTDMLLSAVSVLVVAQPSLEVLERPCIVRMYNYSHKSLHTALTNHALDKKQVTFYKTFAQPFLF